MKEAVTKVIDTLTQEDFDGDFQKLLERYNKCVVAGGDDFKGDLSFMCVLSIKVSIRKKSGNLPYAPRNSSTYALYYLCRQLKTLFFPIYSMRGNFTFILYRLKIPFSFLITSLSKIKICSCLSDDSLLLKQKNMETTISSLNWLKLLFISTF